MVKHAVGCDAQDAARVAVEQSEEQWSWSGSARGQVGEQDWRTSEAGVAAQIPGAVSGALQPVMCAGVVSCGSFPWAFGLGGFFRGCVMEVAAWVFAVLVMVGVPLACWWVL